MQISANNVFFATLGIALVLATFFVAPRTDERPNVLIILIDTVRADHLGAYGYDKPTSPFLDSLFKKGVVFENAYAPAYLTFQADAAILSGLYPSESNVRTWTTPVRDDIRLLPEVFKLYGYTTSLFTWSGLRGYFGLYRGFDQVKKYQTIQNFKPSSRDALDTIRSGARPFFIMWTMYDVHVPMLAALPEFAPERYEGPFATERNFMFPQQSVDSISYYTGDEEIRSHTKSPEDAAYVRSQYDSGIRRVDDSLRQLFSELEESGILENTIVVISAEHGEDLGEHGFFFHRDIYENGIHVPLAIIYPKRFLPRRVAEPVTLLDIAPTVTELAGLPRFEAGEGVSLLPLMKGRAIESRVLYIERPPFKEYAVIDWPWKLIVRDPLRGVEGLSSEPINDFFRSLRKNDIATSDELYNVQTDPGEIENLIEAPQYAGVRMGLVGEATRLRQRSVDALKRNDEISDIRDERVLFSYP